MTFFTAEDFAEQKWQPISSAHAANIANSKLARDAKVVYGRQWEKNTTMWSTGDDLADCTHRALVVCIEKIKKPCEHPKEMLQTHSDFHNAKCGKCGVKLKATWQVCDD